MELSQGTTIQSYLKWLNKTQWWKPEELEELQNKKLRALIKHAYDNVPYYHRVFRELDLKTEDIKTVEDLKRLPYLEKDDIRAAGTRLISDEYNIKDIFAHPTSGSTGMPLTLYNDRKAAFRNYAFRWTHCRPGLILKKDSYANFTGLEIVKPSQKKPPYWRMNYAGKQRTYSIFHMSDETMPYYLEDLARFRPVWFYGYPSAIYTLADFILRSGYDYPHPPKAIVTSSEQCLPEFRKTIEKAFKTRLWDEYGQGEMAGLAFECECGKLHEKIEYALMEFIPTKELADGHQVYELICTSFINNAWPLIRYRVGDLAVIDPNACCTLGKPGRVIEQIYGRTAKFLITDDGSHISNISVIVKKCRNIRAMQAVQDKIGQVKLRVVRQPEYNTETDEPLIIREFRKKLGDESRMKIEIEYVDKIELTKAGKFLSIVSNL